MNKQQFLQKITPIIRDVSHSTNNFVRRLNEVSVMLHNAGTFSTISVAKKDTGLTYLLGYNSSSKTAKGVKENYDTAILYLAAADASGFNLCPMATKGCKQACLVNSGRARMITAGTKVSVANWSRLKKTWLFYYNREYFNQWVMAEISVYSRKAERRGFSFAVRMNGTSDLPITMFSVDEESVVERFPNIQFYDYTKMLKQCRNGVVHDNYDVTFSFANTHEHGNINLAFNTLAIGEKISVVFDTATFPNNSLPEMFLGYDVANGDETDLTFLADKQVLGLTYKKTGADISNNKFVVTYHEYKKLHNEF